MPHIPNGAGTRITCEHANVILKIAFPREISAHSIDSLAFVPVDGLTVGNNLSDVEIQPGRLSVYCNTCRRSDHYTLGRPNYWPLWLRRHFMRVARACPELLSLVHTMDYAKKKVLLEIAT